MFRWSKAEPPRHVLAAVCPSPSGVSSAVVRREPGVPPVLEFVDYVPYDVNRDWTELLRAMVDSNGLEQYPCTSVIGLDAYSLLLVERPDVPAAELQAAISWRVQDLIGFDVADATIDVFEVPAQKDASSAGMVYAVAARSAVVKQLADLLMDANLQLNHIDIPELAVRNVATYLPEDVGGVAMIYLGADGGVIALTRQSTLYLSRRIDSSAMPPMAAGGELTEDSRTWLDTIVIEVQRSLDYYESHYTTPPISGVVVAPLGVPGDGVAEYLSAQLGVPARVLDLNELIDVREPIKPALQAQCFAAIGAALRVDEAA